jgi:hypothetical protein
LRAFDESFGARDPQGKTEPAKQPRRLTEGLLKPVDYSRRTRYRRPPAAYLRLQWLGPLLTNLGIVPANVIILEVPGPTVWGNPAHHSGPDRP